MSENEKLWIELQRLWLSAEKTRTSSGPELQKQAVLFYKTNIKLNKKAITDKIVQLQWKIKSKSNQLATLFAKQSQNHEPTNLEEPVPIPEPEPDNSDSESFEAEDDIEELEVDTDTKQTNQRDCPAQSKELKKIEKINEEIATLTTKTGLLDNVSQKKLGQLRDQKQKAEKTLKRLKTYVKATAKQRAKKNSIYVAVASDPHLASKFSLKVKEKAGKPSYEENHPLLHQTILEIAINQSAAERRRRSEKINTCRTLDDLKLELDKRGFHLSRTALYFRLIPRDGHTHSGKRHVTTVPVKLAKPQNSLRQAHEDSRFASSTIMDIRELGEAMGPLSVTVLSQDDKARVPLGLAAATLQSPILMHVEYAVQMPDHDWVVGSRQKLIASVVAGLEFTKKGEISYSGPTYIAVRSGKHDSSTAFSHYKDLHKLLERESFQKLAKNEFGEVKPILIVFVDGGPDENPRYPKTLTYAVKTFKRLNLDAMFVATNAPHHSAYNPVERRMAPLSRDLAGVIPNPEECGKHLNSSGQTIDLEMEVKNFKKAGEALSEIWSGTVIDKHEVFAEYVDPPCNNGSDSKGSDSFLDVNVKKIINK